MEINVGDLIVAYWNINNYVIGVVTEKHPKKQLWKAIWTGEMRHKLNVKDDEWVSNWEMRNYRRAYLDILNGTENR